MPLPENKLQRWYDKNNHSTDQIWWLIGLSEGSEDVLDISYTLQTDDDAEILWRVLQLRHQRAFDQQERWKNEYRILLDKRNEIDSDKFVKECAKVQAQIDMYSQICSEIGTTQRLIELVLGFDMSYRVEQWYKK